MSLTFNGPAKSIPTLSNAKEQFSLKFGKLCVFGGTIDLPLTKFHIKQFSKTVFTVCLPFVIQYFILTLLKVAFNPL